MTDSSWMAAAGRRRATAGRRRRRLRLWCRRRLLPGGSVVLGREYPPGGQRGGRAEFSGGEVGDQGEVGAVAHHPRPTVIAGRSQRPRDDGARHVVCGDSRLDPDLTPFGGGRRGRCASCHGRAAKHERRGKRVGVQAVRVAGEACGQGAQGDRLDRLRGRIGEDRDGLRYRFARGVCSGSSAYATSPGPRGSGGGGVRQAVWTRARMLTVCATTGLAATLGDGGGPLSCGAAPRFRSRSFELGSRFRQVYGFGGPMTNLMRRGATRDAVVGSATSRSRVSQLGPAVLLFAVVAACGSGTDRLGHPDAHRVTVLRVLNTRAALEVDPFARAVASISGARRGHRAVPLGTFPEFATIDSSM